MKVWMGSIAVLLGCALQSPDARAQQAVTPDPIVQVTISPPRIVVGQQTTLSILALAPNYMTSPPELPDFQMRNAVTRQLQSVNTSEQRDGVSYAGVRFEYAISPQEPGSYAVAGQSVRIKFAAEPPATRDVTVALPPVSFEAFIPDAASTLSPFVSASSLTVEQDIKRSAEPLKAGDAVTRTITISAEGTPAMLLPPQQFPAIDGLRLYPVQPKLEDKVDGRTDVMTSTRIDSATYMVERAGDYELPPIAIDWWNVESGKIAQVRLDAVPLKGIAAAAGSAPSTGQPRGWAWDRAFDFIIDHWRAALLLTALISVLAWFTPRLARRAATDLRRRREAHLRSEAFAFHELRHAIRRRDAKGSYFALLQWLPRIDTVTARDFKAAARDPELDRQLGALERQLFAGRRGSAGWSSGDLLRHVTAARRSLRPRATPRDVAGLPQYLNPAGTSHVTAHENRKPAR